MCTEARVIMKIYPYAVYAVDILDRTHFWVWYLPFASKIAECPTLGRAEFACEVLASLGQYPEFGEIPSGLYVARLYETIETLSFGGYLTPERV